MRKKLFPIVFAAVLMVSIFIPNGDLWALNPQPEPPIYTPLNPSSITINPIDSLDPQPEPPIESSRINTSITVVPRTSLDPQPEPPLPENNIKIFINNINFDKLDPQPEPPMIYQNRTMVPMRAIFESLGASVEWDSSTGTITAKKNDIVIIMKLGETSALVNGQQVTLDAAPFIKNNRTFVPLRFISQSLGKNVEWNEQTRTITIN